MAKLLFSLRGVPDDEADEVRDLLSTHEFDYYETSAGNWGVSMPALWISNDGELAKARELLDVYQQSRAISQRAKYLELKQQGKHTSVFQRIKNEPLSFVGYLAAIALVVYASIKIVFEFNS